MNKLIIQLLSSNVEGDIDILISTINNMDDLFNYLYIANILLHITFVFEDLEEHEPHWDYDTILDGISERFKIPENKMYKIDWDMYIMLGEILEDSFYLTSYPNIIVQDIIKELI